jgi:ribonuclease VapC
MVVDTSVVVAILTGEADVKSLIHALDHAHSIQMSAASVFETAIVIEGRLGAKASKALDTWLRDTPVSVIAVTRDHVEAAREGFRRFGKGRHPASLNFGDCFSYGLAKALGEPLLFRGGDFAKTDIRSALSPSVI